MLFQLAFMNRSDHGLVIAPKPILPQILLKILWATNGNPFAFNSSNGKG
jgi:hypothetical protein